MNHSDTVLDQESVLRKYAEIVREVHDLLTTLDQISGDGDFGDNLRAGLDMVVSELGHHRSEKSAFAVAADVFLDHVGGTSGPLIGLLFQELAAAGNTGETGLDQWKEGMRAGVSAIQRVGEARRGDRTMLDALIPAQDALANKGTIAEAAQAALTGARETADIRARHGRASYVGDRALGAPDPGAMGLALLLWAAQKHQTPGAETQLGARNLFPTALSVT